MPTEGETFHVSFTVPGNPRGKGRPRAGLVGGHVRVYTDAKTRSEEGAIRMVAAAAMSGRSPHSGPVVLRLCAYRAIPSGFSKTKAAAAERGEIVPTTKPDLDNYTKMVDALNGIVWTDDSQVVTAIVHKRYSERPRLVIDVRSVASRG